MESTPNNSPDASDPPQGASDQDTGTRYRRAGYLIGPAALAVNTDKLIVPHRRADSVARSDQAFCLDSYGLL